MHIIYYSHSYRKPDANIVDYFAKLMRSEGLIPSLDPPSKTVNSAKLERHLKSTDAMIAVLTQRDDGISKHILYEIKLCLQAQKPILIFIEDILPNGIVPLRSLQRRFSRNSFLRQTREHRHVIKLLKSYMGDNPAPKYQPNVNKRSCLLIGSTQWPKKLAEAFDDLMNTRVYEVIKIDTEFESFSVSDRHEALVCADLAICFEDSLLPKTQFYFGAVKTSFIPIISLTSNVSYSFDDFIPREYQARIIDLKDNISTMNLLDQQIKVFEEDFLDLESNNEVQAYTNTLVSQGSPVGHYSGDIRNTFITQINEVIMRDKYEAGQVGAQGPNAHAHDMNFSQVWNNMSGSTNLEQLTEELKKLRQYMKENATDADHDVSIGAVAQAEQESKKGNGPKVLEWLSKAGKWALDVATKIGTSIATEALKKSMGL